MPVPSTSLNPSPEHDLRSRDLHHPRTLDLNRRSLENQLTVRFHAQLAAGGDLRRGITFSVAWEP